MFKFSKLDLDHLSERRQKEIIEGGYWIIPSHLDKNLNYDQSTEAVHYWMVTITLTSGDVKQFYIKARTQQDALKKAESYSYLGEIKKGEWSLLP